MFPIKAHELITEGIVYRETKIIKKSSECPIYITIEKEAREKNQARLSSRHDTLDPTTVNYNNPKPKFYGKSLEKLRTTSSGLEEP